jgi:hypothetical protein
VKFSDKVKAERQRQLGEQIETAVCNILELGTYAVIALLFYATIWLAAALG